LYQFLSAGIPAQAVPTGETHVDECRLAAGNFLGRALPAMSESHS